MTDTASQERRYEYFINLPFREALKVGDELDSLVWEIARQNGLVETLKEEKFQVQTGKTAIDPNALITFVITFVASGVANKVLDKTTDKAWEAWKTKIWPVLKQKFGETFLVEKDESEQQEDPQGK